jgi:hypothetical protein
VVKKRKCCSAFRSTDATTNNRCGCTYASTSPLSTDIEIQDNTCNETTEIHRGIGTCNMIKYTRNFVGKGAVIKLYDGDLGQLRKLEVQLRRRTDRGPASTAKIQGISQQEYDIVFCRSVI